MGCWERLAVMLVTMFFFMSLVMTSHMKYICSKLSINIEIVNNKYKNKQNIDFHLSTTKK